MRVRSILELVLLLFRAIHALLVLLLWPIGFNAHRVLLIHFVRLRRRCLFRHRRRRHGSIVCNQRDR